MRKRCHILLVNRVVKIKRDDRGITVIDKRDGETYFIHHTDPRYIRLIGYVGIKCDEMLWIPPKMIDHAMSIVTTCDKETK